MRLLPPACNVLLDVACRKILGWEENRVARRDRISLSQFEDITGFSRNTVRQHLDILHAANILVPYGQPTFDGQEYELNLGQLGDYRTEYLQSLPRRSGDITPAKLGLLSHKNQLEMPVSGGEGGSNFDRGQNLTPSNDCTEGGSNFDPVGGQSVHTQNSKLKNITTNDSLWDLVLRSLKLEMSRSTFETWVENTRLLDSQSGVYTIGVPTSNAKDWLGNRLAASIRRVLISHGANPSAVVFSVIPKEAHHVSA